MALICGSFAADYSPVIGWSTFATGLGAAAALGLGLPRARRISRFTVLYGFSGLLAFAIGLLLASLAVLAARTSVPAFACACVALLALTAVALRRAVDRRRREWDANAAANAKVLDAADGTYAWTRGFTYEAPNTSRRPGRFGRLVVFAAPVVIALFSGAGRRGWGGVRELVLVALGPVLWMMSLPLFAIGIVSWQKLRAYERQLGRDIVNR